MATILQSRQPQVLVLSHWRARPLSSTLLKAMTSGAQPMTEHALSHLSSCSVAARSRWTCPATCNQLILQMQGCLPPMRPQSYKCTGLRSPAKRPPPAGSAHAEHLPPVQPLSWGAAAAWHAIFSPK